MVIERTVDAPRRLVWQMWTESEHFAVWCGPMGASMSDADGNVVDPAGRGMPPGAPVATQIIVELSDLDGKTKIVMTHEGVPADSPGVMGWGMALDKLEARVAELLRSKLAANGPSCGRIVSDGVLEAAQARLAA